MPLETPVKPLGAVLQQAGLVSAAQINLALQEQTTNQMRLGELLCDRGWIQKNTASFFAEQWPTLFHNPVLMPLGQYFLQANLLTTTQIDYLLEQQCLTQLRFGALAVANGWVKLKTINFFLTCFHLQDNGQRQVSEIDQAIDFDTPEYWQYLRDYLLENELANPYTLLQLYEQIYTQHEISFTGDPEQTALLNLGLVAIHQHKLVIAHPIFRSIFNQDWITRELKRTHPYDKIRLQFLNLSKTGAHPYRVLEAILTWTNDQPLLNQKVAHIIRTRSYIQAGEESVIVEQLVQDQLIRHWRTGFAAKHFLSLEEQVLNNSNCAPIDLLTYYQVIWHQVQNPWIASAEEAELVNLGLLILEDQHVRVANQIYRMVFDPVWIDQQISQILEPSISPAPDFILIADQTEDPVTFPSDPEPEPTLPPSPKQTDWRKLGVVGTGLLSLGAAIWVVSRNLQQQSAPYSPQQAAVPTTDPSFKPARSPILKPQTSTPKLQATPNTPAGQPSQDLPPAEPDSSGGVAVVSPNKRLPIFQTGTAEQDILSTLGAPTQKSSGYWPNSYGLLYKNIGRHQTDLGFLFDGTTQRLRQTEATFAQKTDLSTLSRAMNGMLKEQSPAVQQQLSLIYQRQAQEYEFRVGDLEGIIQRNDQDRIYISVWETDFH